MHVPGKQRSQANRLARAVLGNIIPPETEIFDMQLPETQAQYVEAL